MHFSITSFNENGTKQHPANFTHVNQAVGAAQDFNYLLSDSDTTYIVKQHVKGEHPINLYSVTPSGVERLPQLTGWLPLNDENMKYIGPIEFQADDGEYHNFELVHDDNFIVFGGACNVGLLQSGSYLKDNNHSLDENLQELLADLESYYRDGPGYQTDNFLCNECM